MDQALCSKIERPIQFNFEVFQGSNQSGAKKCRRFLMIFGVGNYRVFHKFIPPQTVKQSQVRRHYTRDVYVHKAPVDAGPMPNLGRSPYGDSSRWLDTGYRDVR